MHYDFNMYINNIKNRQPTMVKGSVLIYKTLSKSGFGTFELLNSNWSKFEVKRKPRIIYLSTKN